MYCQKSWHFVLFCGVFYCYYDFRKQHFTKDDNEKKSHGRRNETTLYLRLKTCRKFPQKREHQISTTLRESSLFWASCEMSRECDGQGERRALSLAGWTSTAVLRAIHSHDNFVRLWNLDAFAVYKLYWLLILYFHFHCDLERSEIASNRILKQIGNSWK